LKVLLKWENLPEKTFENLLTEIFCFETVRTAICDKNKSSQHYLKAITRLDQFFIRQHRQSFVAR